MNGAGAGGRTGVGGAGARGGASGSGDAGGDTSGQGGEAGSGQTTAGAGGTLAQAGSNGSSGAAGEGGADVETRTGCEREPQGAVLLDADFSADLFADGAWTRSDSSVTLSGGNLTIGADGAADDYVGVDLTGATLPIVLELRERTTEADPINEVMPVNELFFDGVWLDATYIADSGWMLSNSDYSGSHTQAPEQGEWITLRVLLDTNASELCAKKEGDAAFTRVTTSNLALPDTLFNVHVRQAWDFRYELSALRVQRP